MTGTRHHAADDGSLARSTGGAAARGAMLIALAVVIGILLLWWALDDTDAVSTSPGTDGSVTETTAPDDTGGSGSDDGSADPGATTTTTTTTVATITVAPEQPARPAAEVSVLVANGTGGSGVAGGLSDKLKADGYIADASNAKPVPTVESSIFYDEGYAGDARMIATIIGATPDLIKPNPEGTIGVADNAVDRAENAHVVVIVGTDGLIPTA